MRVSSAVECVGLLPVCLAKKSLVKSPFARSAKLKSFEKLVRRVWVYVVRKFSAILNGNINIPKKVTKGIGKLVCFLKFCRTAIYKTGKMLAPIPIKPVEHT